MNAMWEATMKTWLAACQWPFFDPIAVFDRAYIDAVRKKTS